MNQQQQQQQQQQLPQQQQQQQVVSSARSGSAGTAVKEGEEEGATVQLEAGAVAGAAAKGSEKGGGAEPVASGAALEEDSMEKLGDPMEEDSVSPATVFCIRLKQPRSNLQHKMSVPELCRNFRYSSRCHKFLEFELVISYFLVWSLFLVLKTIRVRCPLNLTLREVELKISKELGV